MIGRESVEGAGETRQPSYIGQERVVFIGSFRLVYVSLCPRLVTQRQVALFAALGGAIKSADCIYLKPWWKAPGSERCAAGC